LSTRLINQCKIISDDSIFFNDKMNHNKLHDNFFNSNKPVFNKSANSQKHRFLFLRTTI
jgi:hypothetical protein